MPLSVLTRYFRYQNRCAANPPESSPDKFEQRFLSGRELYGDDFDQESISEWFAGEHNGYHDLVEAGGRYEYGYHALNERHGYQHLGTSTFNSCLAFGCARGDDVSPIANRVKKIFAIEPAEQWWSSKINETPAEYIAPAVTGSIPLPSGSVDLVVCLHALHHIPNATHLITEFRRVLAPGGILLFNEPISTMGDWRYARRGLTATERGFPIRWLEQSFRTIGFSVERRGLCMFPPLSRAWAKLGFRFYNNRLLVEMDRIVSCLMQWNISYHRNSLLKKFAPSSAFYILKAV